MIPTLITTIPSALSAYQPLQRLVVVYYDAVYSRAIIIVATSSRPGDDCSSSSLPAKGGPIYKKLFLVPLLARLMLPLKLPLPPGPPSARGGCSSLSSSA